jgi:hypothetical protein
MRSARRCDLAASPHTGQAYIEFELDDESLRIVQDLAREAGCEPFDICVQLLREQVAEG